jgi:hypothetical protein
MGIPIWLLALIDTGASCTCISAKVISDLSLAPMGKQPVGGVHGSRPTNAYQFQVGFVFPQSQTPGGAVNANVMSFLVNGIECIPQPGFEVLLGRDVICSGAFTLSFDGYAVLSL